MQTIFHELFGKLMTHLLGEMEWFAIFFVIGALWFGQYALIEARRRRPLLSIILGLVALSLLTFVLSGRWGIIAVIRIFFLASLIYIPIAIATRRATTTRAS